MYKILLVDDERQIRQGLRAKLDWNKHGFELCGEAADGKEALEWIERLRPDVVITDIRMPIMDGVELLRNCQAAYPDIRFIVLSGYEEFNYVKAALKYGACDYLLKPVIRKEMASRLDQIKQELDAKHRERGEEAKLKHQLDEHLQRLREQFWLQVARADNERADWAGEAKRLGLDHMIQPDARIRFVTLEIRDNREDASHSSPDLLLLLAAYLMSRELLQLWSEEAYVFRDPAIPQLLHLVLKCEEFGDEMLENWLHAEFRPQLETMLKVRTRMGLGATVKGEAEWRRGYLSSRLHWMRQPSSAAPSLEVNSLELLPIAEKRLTSSVMEGDMPAFQRTLRSLLDTGSTFTLQDQSVLLLRVLLFFDALGLKHGLKLEETEHMISGLPESLWQLQTADKAEALFVRIAEQLMNHIQRGQPSSGHEVIQRVAAYLHEHYADEDVSLSRMASHFHLHVTYLSELFKKTIGKNFSDYLTEIRITKAQELMNDPRLKVADVSGLVGFSNSNYFSQVFKKMTGLSPMEYRQKPKKL